MNIRMKPVMYMLIAIAIIVIGDDETRLFLKRISSKVWKRGLKKR